MYLTKGVTKNGFSFNQGDRMPVEENPNPFVHDLFHMGVSMGTNCMVMMANHSDQKCHYLKIVNTETGEVLYVFLNKEFAYREKETE